MNASSMYKAVWRWHFYAGLFSIPSLLLLSLTGAIYLFDTQIEDVLYHDVRFVTPSKSPPLPASQLFASLHPAEGETPITYSTPAANNRAASFTFLYNRNEIKNVYLDPYTGAVLGTVVDKSRPMQFVKELHTLTIAGDLANKLVECVAGWAIVLFLTGVYLWWPKTLRDALRIRGAPSQRPFWRDLHRVVGVTAGGAIAFQAFTGLPWTSVWGDIARSTIDASGQGIPPLMRDDRPESKVVQGTVDIGLDKAVAIAAERGMRPGFGMTIPGAPTSVYTAMLLATDDPAEHRVIHIDRYSGEVIADISFADYGAASKLVEFGNAIHMGNFFGTANRIVLLIACVAVWLLSITGIIMWWKRRPNGKRPSTPPLPSRRETIVVLIITVAISLLFPLTAISIVPILLIDRFALVGWRRSRGECAS